MDLMCREYRPEEAAAACAFTEAIFGPLPLECWLKEPSFTASMAFLGDELVGVIPLSLRRFQAAPGVICDTAWENAVGAREDLRGQGVGTAMILAAREFLRDRCDWLTVYRGAERSQGYRFYADKTDHVDLHYVRFFDLAQPEGRKVDGFSTAPMQAVIQRADELARLFRSNWSTYGGFACRSGAVYRWLIDNVIYGRIPTTRRLHTLERDGRLLGFCISGCRDSEDRRSDNVLRIMDFASLDGDLRLAGQLLEGVLAEASELGRSVSWPHTTDSPFLPLIEAAGFQRGPRRMMAMGYPLRPPSMFGKLADARGGCNLTIDVWTPQYDGRLHDAGEGAPRVTLELKDRELALALASRLDGATAFDEERMTSFGPAPDALVRETVSRVFRYTPWVHHYLDWL